MKLTEVYIVGELELIAQQRGKIIVRIVHCNRKVNVYGDKELDKPFSKFYGDFSKKEITLSHPITAFAEGDKVKLSHLIGDNDENDRFSLENLILSASSVCTIDEALSKKPDSPKVAGKELFGIDVDAIIEHIKSDRNGVALRLKCRQKKYIFFDDDQNEAEKSETFDKTIYGIIPKEKMRLDVCIDTIAVYKTGDKVSLSRMIDDDTFDFDNTTLSIAHAKPNYKSKWDL